MPLPWLRFTRKDSVEVMDKGPVYGREAIEKYYTDLFQKVHFSNHLTTYNDPNSPHIIGMPIHMRYFR